MIAPPTRGSVSSPFGWRHFATRDDYHTGIDFLGAKGSPIRAVADGVVAVASPNGGINEYGNVVVIRHNNPSVDAPYSLYAHLSTIRVQQGQKVRAGQLIGNMGNTAASKTDAARVVPVHLHFELLQVWPPPGKDAGRIDPTAYLNPPKKQAPAYTFDQNYTPASGSFSGLDWKNISLWTATAIAGMGIVSYNIYRSMRTRPPLPRMR